MVSEKNRHISWAGLAPEDLYNLNAVGSFISQYKLSFGQEFQKKTAESLKWDILLFCLNEVCPFTEPKQVFQVFFRPRPWVGKKKRKAEGMSCKKWKSSETRAKISVQNSLNWKQERFIFPNNLIWHGFSVQKSIRYEMLLDKSCVGHNFRTTMKNPMLQGSTWPPWLHN